MFAILWQNLWKYRLETPGDITLRIPWGENKAKDKILLAFEFMKKSVGVPKGIPNSVKTAMEEFLSKSVWGFLAVYLKKSIRTDFLNISWRNSCQNHWLSSSWNYERTPCINSEKIWRGSGKNCWEHSKETSSNNCWTDILTYFTYL